MSRSKLPILSLLTLGLSLGLFSCQGGGSASNVHHIAYAYAYGTNWEIHLYEGEESFGQEIVSYVNQTSRLLDPEASSCPNGVYALNHTGVAENVDDFLIEAWMLNREASMYAHDCLSYSLGKLKNAWMDALHEGKTLPKEEVERLNAEAKETSLTLQGKTMKKIGAGEIDFGAVGKGLCLDHVKKMLKQKGIAKYLINAGTSSLLIGENSSSTGKTKIILEDAKNKDFSVKNAAISNSSINRQRYEVGGHVYSHIIDPRTGVPELANDALCLVSSTMGAGGLDAFSTAFLVLGEDYLDELKQFNVSYCLMKDGEVVRASEGFFA